MMWSADGAGPALGAAVLCAQILITSLMQRAAHGLLPAPAWGENPLLTLRTVPV